MILINVSGFMISFFAKQSILNLEIHCLLLLDEGVEKQVEFLELNKDMKKKIIVFIYEELFFINFISPYFPLIIYKTGKDI